MKKTEKLGTLDIELEDVHLQYHRNIKVLWVNPPSYSLLNRGLFRIDLSRLIAGEQDAVTVSGNQVARVDMAGIHSELTFKLVDVEISYIKSLKVLWVNRHHYVGRSSFRIDLDGLMAGDEDAIGVFDKTGTLIKEDKSMATRMPVCPNCGKELNRLNYYGGQFHCLHCSHCMGNTQEEANKRLELVEEPKFNILGGGEGHDCHEKGTKYVEITPQEALSFVKGTHNTMGGWTLIALPSGYIGVVFPYEADGLEYLAQHLGR